MKILTSARTYQLVFKLLGLAFLLLTPFSACFSQVRSLPFKVPADYHVLPETALIETNKGYFEIRFFRQETPMTVSNFSYRAIADLYNGLIFHRYTPDYVIQGGDPEGTGKGGPNYTIPPEFTNIKHRKGTIGMSRLPGERNPERHSNGSQFYICLTDAPHLDGLYTVFAEVINGLEVVEQLRAGDKIIRIRLPKNFTGTALTRK